MRPVNTNTKKEKKPKLREQTKISNIFHLRNLKSDIPHLSYLLISSCLTFVSREGNVDKNIHVRTKLKLVSLNRRKQANTKG
jgi:hypothetical protein